MARKKHPKTTPRARQNRAIPRLDADTDFAALFGAEEQSGGPRNFAAMLDDNLSIEQLTAVLREKTAAADVSVPAAGQYSSSFPPPQAELDLHGLNAREASGRTESFIRSAQRDGLPVVRIITGKGLHSEGDGVLRDLIEQLLLDLKRQEIVQTMRWEKKLKQKSGAVLVVLAVKKR